jgi:26S proteasome regulatory subunit N2
MISCLALSFDPTFTAGLNKDLNFVKKFKIGCNSKPSAFAYPKALTEKKEEEKKRVTTVSLSISAKAKAAADAKKKAKEAKDGAMDVDEGAKKDEKEDKDEKMDVEGEEEKKEGDDDKK